MTKGKFIFNPFRPLDWVKVGIVTFLFSTILPECNPQLAMANDGCELSTAETELLGTIPV